MDNLSIEDRSKNMKSIRSVSSLEVKVGKALWNKGLRFRRNVKSLFGKPDFAIKKYKVVIFIDSCFWHGCEQHKTDPKTNSSYWNKKLSRSKQRDREVTKHYLEHGWRILRIWEHDLKKKHFDEVIQQICYLVEEAKKDSTRK